MGKNRPYIPPPILTPPSVVVPRASETAAAVHEIQAALVAGVEQAAALAPPPALAVVSPPPRVARVELLADRIVLTNPTIKLDGYVFLPGAKDNTNLLQPETATIMHGEIIIEEFGLIWPVAKAHIRTR